MKARTRDAIGDIRHVFLDADRDGQQVLAAIGARRDLPAPSYVLHSSPNRLHVLWRVTGFTRESVEALQKHLARELKTDKAATSCAQTTRMPGFFNHKYRPAPMVVAQYGSTKRVFSPVDFPAAPPTTVALAPPGSKPHRSSTEIIVVERARRYLAAVPPAVAGRHGDADTFRACCRLVRGFALGDEDALVVLSEWNRRCEPPWSEEELRVKIQGARRYGREAIGGLLTMELSAEVEPLNGRRQRFLQLDRHRATPLSEIDHPQAHPQCRRAGKESRRAARASQCKPLN
ncbi:MAG: hypothetical protein H0W53_06680 [Acidobacteria bacterium]|nr:hypothetical protein [Acidobacteriota bacterium]